MVQTARSTGYRFSTCFLTPLLNGRRSRAYGFFNWRPSYAGICFVGKASAGAATLLPPGHPLGAFLVTCLRWHQQDWLSGDFLEFAALGGWVDDPPPGRS